MTENLRLHLKFYLMEAIGLAGFVVGAALLTIFLEHPALAVMNSPLKNWPLLRRLPLGVVMGLYVYAVTTLFGKKSGAFINPAVTCGYLRLGRIRPADAIFYTIAQFLGAILAAQALKYFIPNLFGHPAVDFGVTKPKPPIGSITAFTAELLISFVAMFALLYAGGSKKLEKYAALISGTLLGLYLIFETPLSGMSMNPARSLAGALAADEWKHLWIYFLAPILGTMLATEIYLSMSNRKSKNESVDLSIKKFYPA